MLYVIPNGEYTSINSQFPNRIEFGFDKHGVYYFDDNIIPHLDVDYDAVFQSLFGQTLLQYLATKVQAPQQVNPAQLKFTSKLQTNSKNMTPISGITTTPEEGNYYATYTSYVKATKTVTVTIGIFKNGVLIEDSERSVKIRGGYESLLGTEAQAICNGSDVIEVHYKINSTKGVLTTYKRSLILINAE